MYDLIHIRPKPKWRPTPGETKAIVQGLTRGPARPRHLLTDDGFERQYDPSGWRENRAVGLLSRIADTLDEMVQAQLPPLPRPAHPRRQAPSSDQPRPRGSIEQL